MASLSDIIVKKELRLCKIDKELGYFHCWEQYADPGDQYSRVFGIVEFDDRIKRVDPTKIQFIDELIIIYMLEKNILVRLKSRSERRKNA